MRTPVFAVLGAGSWGTAVAIHLARAGYRVLLWGRDAPALIEMQRTRMNTRYLPEIVFPPSLCPMTDLAACLDEADEICLAVPSHAFLSVLKQIQPVRQRLLWITKGMDAETHLFFSDLIHQTWGAQVACAMLSGPSFALEVAKGLPTALTLASHDASYQQQLLQYFHQGAMRVYLSQDLLGVQLCGILKNVLAIACGMSDGLAFGANAKAALITRGLVEMRLLGQAMGAQEQTFTGLAGLGDLVLTCTDNQSRNRRFGFALGQGHTQAEAFTLIQQVVEGVGHTEQIMQFSQQYQVEMPICSAVHQVLTGVLSIRQAADSLIRRGG